MLSVEKRERFSLRFQKTIVLIYTDALNYSTGHGVLISSNGYILTASHLFGSDSLEHSIGSEVVVECNGVTVPRYHAKIIAIERKFDLALLQIVKAVDNRKKKLRFKYARLGEVVQIGQEVHMIMSTDDHNFSYTSGLVSFGHRLCADIVDQEQISFISEETYFVQGHGLHGIPGCSGAPVFDSRGEIIGIYSAGYRRMDLLVHLTLLIKMCRPFFQKLERVKKRKRAMMMVIGPYKKFKGGLKQEKRKRKKNASMRKLNL